MESDLDRLRLSLSWLVIFWERLWRALWPAFALLVLFAALALFDLPAHISPWLHLGFLVLVVAGVVAAVTGGLRRFRQPTGINAIRRLQRVNRLAHRPLETLADSLAVGLDADPRARALWRLHQERMRNTVHRLRVGLPSPRLIRMDPWAFRVALAVLLAASVFAAGGDAPARLARAMVPQLAVFQPPKPPVIDAWVTPPTYTGIAPIFLTGPDAKATKLVESPSGSQLAIRITGGSGSPVIERTGGTVPTTRHDEASYSADLKIEASETVAVVQDGERVAEWTLRAIPDEVPRIAFVAPPSQGRRSVLRIDFQASDDYGLSGTRAIIRRPQAKGASGEGKSEAVDLPLPTLGAKQATATSYSDLTPHPWAGLPVEIQLEATDGAGQVGRSGPFRMTLPERTFSHPVAREIIVERRKLIADPEEAASVALALRDIAWGQERYNHDVVVFMALGLASRRLEDGDGQGKVDSLQTLLWDTALRVEDGRLSLAQRSLREAEEALRKALEAKNTTDAELNRLLKELETALNSYFDELSKMMRDVDPKTLQSMPRDPNTLAMTRQDFKNIMDEIRKLAQSGSRDAAKQMLSQLKNLLETMRTGRMAGMSKQGQESMKLLNDLQDLIRGQQELLDKTFRDAQRRGMSRPGQRPGEMRPGEMRPGEMRPGEMRPGEVPGPMQPGQEGGEMQAQPGGQMSPDGQTQEALRHRLGELMRRLGELSNQIPRPMGRAEQSMRRSTRFLNNNRPGEAVTPQTQAIDQLQESARSATQQLMQQMGQGMGMRPGQMGESQQDPLGRTPDGAGGMNTSDVGIPEADAMQRAREIRDELRRRAGQHYRPEAEREYIDRLLKQF